MPNRQHKRLCAKCGKRHVKPTGRKCKMASQSPPVSTAPSASGNTNEAQSAMALTPVATSTTVTATTSFCTIGATTVTTTVSSAGSGGGMTSMAGPSIGSTLQVLAATLSTLSARMDSMESALHAHAAAPPAPGPPPPPASQPAQHAATPTGVVPTTAGQPHLAPSILPLHPHIAPTGAAPMTPPLPPPTSHPPQPAMGVATHAPAVHPVVPPSQAAARVQRELGFLDDYAGSSSDSDDPSPPRTHSKSHKLKSGRSRTSEDIVIRQVDWPHFNVFKGPSRKAAEYDSLSIAEFVFGYLGNALKPNTSSGDRWAMLRHLRDLMHDATMYPWEGVRNFHGIVLRLMEHDEATWADKALIQELRAQYARTPAPTSSHGGHSAQSRPCPEFQRGACSHAEDHESPHGGWLPHVCGWCLRVRRKYYKHAEKDCFTKKKRDSKNEETG